MDMGVAVDLVMGIMDMVEDLEVSLLLLWGFVFAFFFFFSFILFLHSEMFIPSLTIHIKLNSIAKAILLALRSTPSCWLTPQPYGLLYKDAS